MAGCDNYPSGIDIIHANASACSLRCNYQPIYKATTVTCENKGSYMEFSFINNSYTTIYNGNSYKASKMRLYQPSLHKYNGDKMPAELVIQHYPETGNKELNICIPVDRGGPTSTIAGDLISESCILTNSVNSEATIANFTLSSLIPHAPFYTYIGENTYSSCDTAADFIVFDDKDAIKISNAILKSIKNVITKTKSNILAGVLYYYNKDGPNTATSGEIYIDCQPTGMSEEVSTYYSDKKSKTIFDNKTVILILVFLFVSILIALLFYAVNKMFV
jgi:carbonic anhydrase